MAHLEIVQPTQAPKEVQAVYEEFHRRMSFPSPPNFIMTQGHSPTVARGTWELVRNVLVSGEIARWMKEMMFVAISKGSSVSLLHGGPHRLLPHVGGESRNLESTRP